MPLQENSRMFAGKKIHPFFSSWKVGKRCNQATDPDNNGCSVEKSHRNVTFGPIHVFERIQVCEFSCSYIYAQKFISGFCFEFQTLMSENLFSKGVKLNKLLCRMMMCRWIGKVGYFLKDLS